MNEIRSIQTTELRMSEDGRRLSGYAAKYGVESRDGGLPFTEVIDRGAFDISLEAGDDVVALFNHDASKVLGRRDSGTLRLTSDNTGLFFDLTLPETATGDEVRTLVQRGDINQTSFAFVVEDDTWKNDSGKRTRHLRQVALKDVSLVTEAAYLFNTELQLRGNSMSANGSELYNELRNLTQQAQQILDSENRSAEDQQKLDKLFSRVDEIELGIKEARNTEKLDEMNALLDEPVRNISKRSGSKDDSEYREAFMSYLRTGDRRELRAMNITNDGAVVPTDLERTLIEKLDALSVIRSEATVYNWDSNRDVPIEDAIGVAGWTAEEGTITPADSSFGTSLEFRAYKATAAVRVSNELMEDSLAVNMEQYLGRVLGRRFSILLEEAYCNGDGSSKPSGLIPNAGTAGTTHTCATGEVTFGAVDGDDIIDTVHKLSPQYRAGAKWVMTDSMLKAVRQITDSNGDYLWRMPSEASGLRDGIPGTLYGYPIVVIDDAYGPSEAAGARAAIFGDLKNFWIADRGPGTTMLLDPYSNALSGQTDMVAYRRTDSHVVLPEAFSVLKLAAS